MAIAIGNKANSNQNPNGTSQTLSFNSGASGTDKGLFVALTMPSTVNVTGATYGGVAMSIVSNNISTEGQRVTTFYLQNPANGVNNIVISFNGSQFNSTSIFAFVVYGADGIDNFAWNDVSTSPNSRSITILQNSLIYVTGLSINAQTATQYSIGGSSRVWEFSHNTNKIVRGAISATGLSAGATNVTTYADFGSITNLRVAIKEKAVVARRRIIIT